MVVNAVIVFFYVMQHLSTVLLLKKTVRTAGLFLAIGIITYSSIYFLKSPSYDLLIYLTAFNYAAIFEPGYYLLSTSLISLGLPNDWALNIIRLLLAFLFIVPSIKVIRKDKNLLESLVLALIIVSSVAFTLAVNNVLRQGFASIFIMISFYQFLDGKKVTFILFAVLSVLFHLSAPFFIAYMLFIYYLSQSLYEGHLAKVELLKFSSGVNSIVLFLIPIAAISLILVATQFIFSGYLSMNLATGESERTTAIVKTLFVAIVFIVSEWSFGRYGSELDKFTVLRFARLAFISLVFWMSLNPQLNELASRILYFYFVVEMFVILHAYQRAKYPGVVLTLISYGFALNAINILTGGGH